MPGQRTPVTGEIHAGSFYDTEALLRATGIGQVLLAQLRSSGRLPTYGIDGKEWGRNWYRGEDIIALFKPKPLKKTARKIGANDRAADERRS